jgi:hypothetical protein
MFRYALVAVIFLGVSITAQAQGAASAQEPSVCEAVNQTINGYLKHIALASERSYATGTSGRYGGPELTNAFRIIRLNVELLKDYDCKPRALPIDPMNYWSDAKKCLGTKNSNDHTSKACDMSRWHGRKPEGNSANG